jgi:hypothetical protein
MLHASAGRQLLDCRQSPCGLSQRQRLHRRHERALQQRPRRSGRLPLQLRHMLGGHRLPEQPDLRLPWVGVHGRRRQCVRAWQLPRRRRLRRARVLLAFSERDFVRSSRGVLLPYSRRRVRHRCGLRVATRRHVHVLDHGIAMGVSDPGLHGLPSLAFGWLSCGVPTPWIHGVP